MSEDPWRRPAPRGAAGACARLAGVVLCALLACSPLAATGAPAGAQPASQGAAPAAAARSQGTASSSTAPSSPAASRAAGTVPVAASAPSPRPAADLRVIEDDQVRIEETRVRGQLQRVTVSPKGSAMGPYQINVGAGGRDPSQDKSAAGQRVWSVLQF